MSLVSTPAMDRNATALEFNLLGVDGEQHSLADAKGPRGLLVAFICNHCPYVQAVGPALAEDARKLQAAGIGVIGIMPNDVQTYPEDSLDRMKDYAREWGFSFPYVIDETQEVSQAYGAVCTPDFFGYNANLQLRFRGRFDSAGGPNPAVDRSGARRELLDTMLEIAETGDSEIPQTPSMGCSIKWRA